MLYYSYTVMLLISSAFVGIGLGIVGTPWYIALLFLLLYTFFVAAVGLVAVHDFEKSIRERVNAAKN